MLAINCKSWYSILFYGMKAADWMCLPELVENEIKTVILREGLSEVEATRYFALSGPLNISQPHGPNPAARLNWAMAVLLQNILLLDGNRLSQPQVCHIMNREVYHAAEFSKHGTPSEFFLAGFRQL